MSELSLDLAHHIGLVLLEEDSTVLSHPTVSYFMKLLHIDDRKYDLPQVTEVTYFKIPENFIAFMTLLLLFKLIF